MTKEKRLEAEKVLSAYRYVYKAFLLTPLDVILENQYEYALLFDHYYQGLWLLFTKYNPRPKRYRLKG